MLGVRSAQRGLLESDHLYLDYVGRGSFYGFLASLRGQPPHAYASIILDCDSDSIERLETPGQSWWGSTPTPTPSWMVINERPRTPTRRAGGIHCVYALEVTHSTP